MTNQFEQKEIKLNLLHDHFKDSFIYIREREKLRDKLFYIIISLFGILAFQIQYPINFHNALTTISILETNFDLRIVPLQAILSLTWTFIFVLLMKYYQTTINIERQYPYLHKIEEKISELLEDKEIYCREGYEYLNKYPVFSDWTWIFYTYIMPLVFLSTTIILVYNECSNLEYPNYYKVYDLIIALFIIITLILYKIKPKK